MRKWITIAVLAALLSALVLTAYASQSRLTVEDVQVKPGETVYVKLELTQTTVGDSMGVTYTYDSTVLKPLKSSSTWARKGMLQDFDTKKGTGVWADAAASDMKGLVCTLAFEVVSREAHFDTSVNCTLIVKNGSKDVGTYTAKAAVSTICDHKYGQWQDAGALGHSRTCQICSRSQSQAHRWDDGTTSAIPNRPGMDMTTFTCKDCGGTKKIEHISSNKPTVPVETLPPETEPSEPTWPTETGPSEPTKPNDDQGGTSGGNQGGASGGSQGGTSSNPGSDSPTVPGGDDHNHATIPGFNGGTPNPTFPTYNDTPTIPTTQDHDHGQSTLPTAEDDHDHDHSSDSVIPVVDSETKTRNMLVFFGTLAVLGGLALFFVKRKRR